nr:hypothetical protein [Cryobacterium sp.]
MTGQTDKKVLESALAAQRLHSVGVSDVAVAVSVNSGHDGTREHEHPD